MSMPSRSSREQAGKPAASDEHTSRQQSPASDPSDSSRDMPIGSAGIDFQPPPSLKNPRSSPTRQVVVATKVTSPENSEKRRRFDSDQRQQHQQRQPSSRPQPAPWSIHEGQGQHPQQQQYPPYQAGAMPFSVPRSQQQVRYSLAILCD
jgi:hypothetical protein